MNEEKELAVGIHEQKTIISVDGESIYVESRNTVENLSELATRILALHTSFKQTDRIIELFVEEVLSEMPLSGGIIPRSAIEDFIWFCNKSS